MTTLVVKFRGPVAVIPDNVQFTLSSKVHAKPQVGDECSKDDPFKTSPTTAKILDSMTND